MSHIWILSILIKYQVCFFVLFKLVSIEVLHSVLLQVLCTQFSLLWLLLHANAHTLCAQCTVQVARSLELWLVGIINYLQFELNSSQTFD